MKRGAVIVLERSDNAVLMQHRDNNPRIVYPDFWGLPAGGAEPRESTRKAGVREIWEETGYELAETDLSFVYQSLQRLPDRQVLRSIFAAMYDGVQVIQCLEGQEMKFIQPEELSNLQVVPEHVKFIRDAEKKFYLPSKEKR